MVVAVLRRRKSLMASLDGRCQRESFGWFHNCGPITREHCPASLRDLCRQFEEKRNRRFERRGPFRGQLDLERFINLRRLDQF